MTNEVYEKLKFFLESDLKIKKELYNIKPIINDYAINNDAIVKYVDNTYDTLKYIFHELKRMIIPFDNDELFMTKINELEKIIMERFINCKTNIDLLNRFYEECITDMSNDIIDGVKKEVTGYSLFYIPINTLKKCKTINELLHIMHFTVMNNENILQSVNIINTRNILNDTPLTLYGEPNDISLDIFNNFPNNLDVGFTDIVSFGNDNKVIMMIRDRGHALSIEIDQVNENEYKINYFIPKLCNIEMIKMLPGLFPIKDNANIFDGACGVFYTNKENIVNSLTDFISMVPTDMDNPIVQKYFNR